MMRSFGPLVKAGDVLQLPELTATATDAPHQATIAIPTTCNCDLHTGVPRPAGQPGVQRCGHAPWPSTELCRPDVKVSCSRAMVRIVDTEQGPSGRTLPYSRSMARIRPCLHSTVFVDVDVGLADYGIVGSGIGVGRPPCCDVARPPSWKPVTLGLEPTSAVRPDCDATRPSPKEASRTQFSEMTDGKSRHERMRDKSVPYLPPFLKHEVSADIDNLTERVKRFNAFRKILLVLDGGLRTVCRPPEDARSRTVVELMRADEGGMRLE
ncbi:hypothetical protein PR048_031341 [Dryococelus australis]|uniref:Uncharacterized protein n=1 Tax=Dryococelus australis TaxID=614101 RepID=A0ABQ9G925_9NEOP|nr:hypothetical protein PR048_031341 [Dryococelus australis]